MDIVDKKCNQIGMLLALHCHNKEVALKIGDLVDDIAEEYYKMKDLVDKLENEEEKDDMTDWLISREDSIGYNIGGKNVNS